MMILKEVSDLKLLTTQGDAAVLLFKSLFGALSANTIPFLYSFGFSL